MSYRRKATKNKKVRNAKTNTVDGIKFRSKLESFTYRKLLEAGIDNFNYETDRFTLQEAFEFTNESYELSSNRVFENVTPSIRAMTYKPDFVSINDDKKGWVIEVKGFANDALIGSALIQ